MNRTLIATIATLSCLASRMVSAGLPDPGFGDDGIALLSLDGVEGHELRTTAMTALPDGSLLFGGSRDRRVAGSPDPHTRAMVAMMNADGTPSSGFGTNPAIPGIRVLDDLVPGAAMQQIESLQRLSDGTIVAAGTAQVFAPLTCFVVRLAADGERDMTFGSEGLASIPSARCHALVVDGDGRIVVAGERRVTGVTMEAFVARFDADGVLDAAFGDGGISVLPARSDGESGYLAALAVAADGALVAGGSYEAYGEGLGTDFSLARFGSDGQLDGTFANGGWRVFHIKGDASAFNGIDRLLVLADGRIVFAGHRMDAQESVHAVLGRTLADGATDPAFGSTGMPGFAPLDFAPNAATRYATALVRQADGHFVAAATSTGPDKSDFVAFRTDDRGGLDPSFGEAGIAAIDLAPNGIYSSSTALALQGDVPVVAGSVRRDASSLMVDIGAVRLDRRPAGDDVVFADGFETSAMTHVTGYDDLDEGFLGTAFDHDGIHYHDCNGIGGVFPDGKTFTADDVGDQFVVENAALMYVDFPDYGSAPNVLTFGSSYIDGDNFSLGPLVRATMDLGREADGARFDLAYYENGPWGGIVLHLDATRNGVVVGSDTLTIAGGAPRDNLATASLSVQGVAFDAIRLYATYGDQPTAPRVMIDDLVVTRR